MSLSYWSCASKRNFHETDRIAVKEDQVGENKSKKQQKAQKGKPSGAGRREGKFEGFFARTSECKLRNVLKNSGAKAAKAFVQEGGSFALLRKIAHEGTFAGSVACEALGR
ncbi:MAG: hypothetical protein AAB857_01225 [Patescibacteria group bacterium]